MESVKLVLFLCVIAFSTGTKNLSVNELDNKQKTKGNRIPRTCAASKIDVRLEKLSKFFKGYDHKGFVRISLPSFKRPLNVCFPKDHQEFAQVFLLTHALCRQLGFMTFTNIQEKRILPDDEHWREDTDSTTQLPLESLKPTSWTCKGHEQTVSQCKWSNIETEECNLITETTCGSCQSTMTNLEDTIKIPGYPSAFLYDLTCEWQIVLPETYTISLAFDGLNRQPLTQCASDKFYIELVYGSPEKFGVQRYCDFRKAKNLSIPYHSLKIRYFSGLYNPRDLHASPEEQSLVISYKAILETSTSFWWLIIMALILVLVISALGATCYCCQKYIELFQKRNDLQQEALPNAPGKEDLDRAYEFQRCQIQGKNIKPGLRLRSTGGSRPRLSSLFNSVSSASDSLVSVFRKISHTSTPRTIIPDILYNGKYVEDGKYVVVSKCKTNLQDRFSTSTSNDCSDSSVFLPMELEPNFQIYRSESSDYIPQPVQNSLQFRKETAI